MLSLLVQEMMMDDSGRTAGYRKMKSGVAEDVRVGSPLRKDRLVYWFRLGFHLRKRQGRSDEGTHPSMSPCFPCWILKAFRAEPGPARAMQDAWNCQTWGSTYLLIDVRKVVCDIHCCLCATVGADLVAIAAESNDWFGRGALVDAALPS